MGVERGFIITCEIPVELSPVDAMVYIMTKSCLPLCFLEAIESAEWRTYRPGESTVHEVA